MDKLKVLDHGYVKMVEAWGQDSSIIEAARMSTNKGFNGWGPFYECEHCGCRWRDNLDNTMSLYDADQKSCSICEHKHLPLSKMSKKFGDEKLLKYLYDNKHSTPFEFAGMVIEVQAPIFVFREWHRHRTQSYNEMSARYTPLPDVNYVPLIDRLYMTQGDNKQAQTVGGADNLTENFSEAWLMQLESCYKQAEILYQKGLKMGIPKEVARVVLPVGRYSRMRASANLRNWLGFLTLRMASNAQWEIRQYANAVGELIADRFPKTWELFIS